MTSRSRCPTTPAPSAQIPSTLTLDATEPLQTYKVSVRGNGHAYDDPAALLRGEAGRPVELTMDLVWATAGTPYQYRITPRYEIPCTVSGTVVADGRTVVMDSVPGQRDHSWGVRDWWSMDWVWSALHLDDGTHIHGVDIRIPGAPPIGIGYVQPPDGPLVELQVVTAQEAFGDNDLPRTTSIRFGDLTAAVDIRGPRTGASHRRRRPGEPFPAGMGDGHHRRWPHWGRLGRVEPQPTLTPFPRATQTR